MFVLPKTSSRREAAVRLRRSGMSLSQIADELGAAKSSASVWVRGIPRGGELPPGGHPMPPLVALPVWSSGVVRCCSRCRTTLPDVCFNRHRSERQWWCRKCFKTYFRERQSEHLAQVKRAKTLRRQATRAALLRHLESNPCADCGEVDPVVLECDHIGVKTAEISRLVQSGAPVERLKQELTQCDVVCANCHRRRTSLRAGWIKARPHWREVLCRDGAVSRNLRFIYEHLEGAGCADCGLIDLSVLEFDHVGPKRGMVALMSRNGVSLATLADEVANCEVRCANCHRRRTAERAAACRPASTLRGPP